MTKLKEWTECKLMLVIDINLFYAKNSYLCQNELFYASNMYLFELCFMGRF